MTTSSHGDVPAENDGGLQGAGAVEVARLFSELLRRTHLSTPADVGSILTEEFERIGATDAVFYVADYEEVHLVPIPVAGRPSRQPLSIDGSLAGRAFSATTIVTAAADDPGRRKLLLPLIDGTERLGAVEVIVPAPGGAVAPDLAVACERTPTWRPP